MNYKTYIFDLDGTLLDTLLDLANAVNYSMRMMNYPERTVEEVRNFIGNGVRVLIRRAVPEGTSDENYEKAYNRFREYYNSHLADCTVPYDGIMNVIDTLCQAGCKTAVVSNKSHDSAQQVVKHFFGDRFNMVVGKMERFPTKPNPDSVLYVIDELGADKESCVYIGDSEVDVQTAHNAGLPCIGVTWGNRDRQELESNSAEFIAETPQEILNF